VSAQASSSHTRSTEVFTLESSFPVHAPNIAFSNVKSGQWEVRPGEYQIGEHCIDSCPIQLLLPPVPPRRSNTDLSHPLLCRSQDRRRSERSHHEGKPQRFIGNETPMKTRYHSPAYSRDMLVSHEPPLNPEPSPPQTNIPQGKIVCARCSSTEWPKNRPPHTSRRRGTPRPMRGPSCTQTQADALALTYHDSETNPTSVFARREQIMKLTNETHARARARAHTHTHTHTQGGLQTATWC
jgi:hypothetical protein